MLANFCTYLVCAEINQSQSRSPDLNQVLIACALERVLTIMKWRVGTKLSIQLLILAQMLGEL